MRIQPSVVVYGHIRDIGQNGVGPSKGDESRLGEKNRFLYQNIPSALSRATIRKPVSPKGEKNRMNSFRLCFIEGRLF